mmetsp:Transcript_106604/g.299529  ORF Transcript_106604/g.299529 Transcript_106604/m.299529 type:complete len:345 (-) Transcript_106604:847-1881(-)
MLTIVDLRLLRLKLRRCCSRPRRCCNWRFPSRGRPLLALSEPPPLEPLVQRLFEVRARVARPNRRLWQVQISHPDGVPAARTLGRATGGGWRRRYGRKVSRLWKVKVTKRTRHPTARATDHHRQERRIPKRRRTARTQSGRPQHYGPRASARLDPTPVSSMGARCAKCSEVRPLPGRPPQVTLEAAAGRNSGLFLAGRRLRVIEGKLGTASGSVQRVSVAETGEARASERTSKPNLCGATARWHNHVNTSAAAENEENRHASMSATAWRSLRLVSTRGRSTLDGPTGTRECGPKRTAITLRSCCWPAQLPLMGWRAAADRCPSGASTGGLRRGGGKVVPVNIQG